MKDLILVQIFSHDRWKQLKHYVREAPVSMKMSHAFCRHLNAIVVDARCMLELQHHVIVQLRVSHFDDGK